MPLRKHLHIFFVTLKTKRSPTPTKNILFDSIATLNRYFHQLKERDVISDYKIMKEIKVIGKKVVKFLKFSNI